MKKIHKQIIAKQAKCLDKALERLNFPLIHDRNRRYGARLLSYLKVVGENNLVFSRGRDKVAHMSDGNKAKFIRQLFKHKRFSHMDNGGVSHRKSCGRNWALHHHSTCFDFKLELCAAVYTIEGKWSFSNRDNVIELAQKFR